jgi:hypothetical protein
MVPTGFMGLIIGLINAAGRLSASNHRPNRAAPLARSSPVHRCVVCHFTQVWVPTLLVPLCNVVIVGAQKPAAWCSIVRRKGV